MKASEKQVIYDFLKTTCDYIDGFKSQESRPVFSDDVLNAPPTKTATSTVNTERIPANQILPQQEQQAKTQTASPQETVNVNNVHEKNKTYSLAKVLFQTKHTTVYGEGITEKPLVMIIAEEPHSENADAPLGGQTGELLDKMLQAINLSRQTNCYIASIPKNSTLEGKEIDSELSACRLEFKKQINIIQPSMIILMGRTAVFTILDTSEGIGRIHGKLYNYNGVPTISTYHPSTLLHDESLKRPAWEDLKIVRAELNKI